MKKNILNSLAVIIIGVVMFLLGNYIAANNFQIVATTDNPQKANEIQETLTMFTRPTIRFVDGSKYMIAILGTNKEEVDYAAVELIEKGIITDDVGLNSNVDDIYSYFTNPKKVQKLEKLLNRALSKRLSHVEGIYSATTDIKIPVLTFDSDSADNVTASMTIKTNKAFDLERISANAKTVLTASIPRLTKENIKINFEFEE